MHDVAIKLGLRDEEIPRVGNFEEVRMSLLQRAEKWTREWLAEGEAKGMAKGEARGQRLGMAKTLKNLVQRRFGDLPDGAVDRIDRADVDTLETWSYRILDVTSIEELFQGEDSTNEPSRD